MATIVKEQRLQDSSKRALLKYVITTDANAGANTLANTVLVSVSSLQNSLNVNNKILGAGSDALPYYKVDIKRIVASGKVSGYITLQWQGAGAGLNSNSEIVVIGNGFQDFKFDDGGSIGGGLFNNPVAPANGNGNILISVTNPLAGDASVIIIDIKKDAQYFDAGQTADPRAFNR